MQRATKGNIKETILCAIDKAANDCFDLTGLHIKKSPEYICNTYIVQEVCETFDKVGFRLEMKFAELFDLFGVERKFPSHIGPGAKFDIVLIGRKSLKPRHVIEVKRSISIKQVLRESKRIQFVAESNHGNQRLETGFIVCVTRTKEKGWTAEAVIQDRKVRLENQLGRQYQISSVHRQYGQGELGFPDGDCLLVVVFEIKKI